MGSSTKRCRPGLWRLIVVAILLAGILQYPSSAALNGTETLITTATDSSAQTNPAIYGTFIAWEDGRTVNPNIYVYNLANGEEYPPLPDSSLIQTAPALYGTRAVWQQLDTNSITYTIQVFDLVTHDLIPVSANPGTDPQYTPDDNCFPKIFEDEIVWQDYNGGDWDIYLYNITTSASSAIVTGSGNQQHPEIFGNYVAYENWSDPAHPEIWLYDIANASSIPVSEGSYAILPALSQTFVVWQDQSGPVPRVFSYSIVTGAVDQVTPVSLTTRQANPAIFDHFTVVEDYRQSANAGIYLYDLFIRCRNLGLPPA